MSTEQSSGYLLTILAGIATLSLFSTTLGIRAFDRKPLGKTAFNERLKYTANALDRSSTACFIAAFIAPESRLSRIDLGTTPEVKTWLIATIWILASVALHLFGSNLLTRVKD